MDRGRLLASLAILPVVDALVGFVAFPTVLQLGPQQAVAFAVLAGILGLLVMIPFALGHLAMGTLSEHLIPVSALLAGALFPVGIGSCMGMISAVVFWFVAIYGTGVTR